MTAAFARGRRPDGRAGWWLETDTNRRFEMVPAVKVREYFTSYVYGLNLLRTLTGE